MTKTTGISLPATKADDDDDVELIDETELSDDDEEEGEEAQKFKSNENALVRT
jgi:hypothetical protein